MTPFLIALSSSFETAVQSVGARHSEDERPARRPERDAANGAQRREGNDERVRDSAPNKGEAVEETDSGAGSEDRCDHDRSRVTVAEQERADDGRECDRRADREVDPARDDYQELAEGENRDHRRLRKDVADVLTGAKHGGGRRDGDDKDEEDQKRAGAQREQPELEEPVPVDGVGLPEALHRPSPMLIRDRGLFHLHRVVRPVGEVSNGCAPPGPDDPGHELFLVVRCCRRFADLASAAHHHSAVRNGHHVVHRVRDQDDRDTGSSEPID